MYYEIYIDVLFLSNFLLDYLLLNFVWRMLVLSSNHVRILLGAAVGAALACAVILIPLPYPMVKYALFHLVISTIMIKTAYRITDRTCLIEAIGCLYVSAFLMGGILHFLDPYIGQNWILAAVIVSDFLMRGIGLFVKRLNRNQKSKCQVVLYTSTGTYELRALLDTGNELKDAVSKKGVSVIGNALAREIFSEVEMNTVRYVPYQSIGKSGVLPTVRIEKMKVLVDKSGNHDGSKFEKWKQKGLLETSEFKEIKEPMIGISERDISTKDAYQIILNPDILGGM